MKTTYRNFIAILCLTLALPFTGTAQDAPTSLVPFEVHQVYPYISVNRAALQSAATLLDLNPRFKPAWVREYYTVDISTHHAGKLVRLSGGNDQLSAAQKALISAADAGTEVHVHIRYLPENDLRHNEAKAMDFSFTIDPDQAARYPGGSAPLKQYLREKAINHIPDGTFVGYDMAAIQFTVSKAGEIVNAQVVESTKEEAIDQLLLEAIRNMPCWQPATYADGTTVAQQFVLTVGNMENCLIYTLNIKRNGPG